MADGGFDAMSVGTDTGYSGAEYAVAPVYASTLDTVAGQQNALNVAGFGPLVVDGKYGPLSIAAVKAFQASRKLAVDGKVGPATKSALLAALLAANPARSDTEIATQIVNQTGLTPEVATQIVQAQTNAPAAPSAPIVPTPQEIQKAQQGAPNVPSLSPPPGFVPIEKVSYFTGITDDPKKMLLVGGVATAAVVTLLVIVKATKKPRQSNPRRRRRRR